LYRGLAHFSKAKNHPGKESGLLFQYGMCTLRTPSSMGVSRV